MRGSPLSQKSTFLTISFLDNKVLESMNRLVNSPFSVTYVIKSIFELHPSKSLRPIYAYMKLFYQKKK